eukprot:COSAG05_NODE_326_length_11360_cov_47.871781_6_plen_189_part_00
MAPPCLAAAAGRGMRRLTTGTLRRRTGASREALHGGLAEIACKSAEPASASTDSSLFFPCWAAPASAYVHIPFCRQKCRYCDFTVQAVGTDPKLGVRDTMASYTRTVCQEIRATAAAAAAAAAAEAGTSAGHHLSDTTSAPLMTVYIGGGTPSLLPVPMLGKCLLHYRQPCSGVCSNCGVCPVSHDSR